MSTNTKRRVFLKGSLAAGTIGVAAGAGLLAPQAVIAAWNEAAFKAKSIDDALTAAMGGASNTASDAITIKAPDIAENGAVVPVSVSTDMAGAESIALLAEDRTDHFVLYPTTVLGVWDVDASAFAFGGGSATALFRYDHLLAQTKGLTEANLKVWRYDNGWVDVTGSVDTTEKTITTKPLTRFSLLAVSTAIPGDEPPQGTAVMIR